MTLKTRAPSVLGGLWWALLLSFAGTAHAQTTGVNGEGALAGEELPLDDNAAFAHARSYYEASDYEGCQEEFSTLLQADSPKRLQARELVEQGRIYHAACLLGLGKPREADEQLKAAIRDNPLLAAPDPLLFPALFVNRFFGVRSQLLEEIRRAEEQRVERLKREAEAAQQQDAAILARIKELEQLAAREAVVDKNNRWLAAVPFGVGQFQNREPGWGWFFLTTEMLCAGAAIASVSVQLSLNSQAEGGRTSKNTQEITRRLDIAHKVELGALGGLIGLAGIGILQAQLAFVPEHRLPDRPRSIQRPPKAPTLAPSAAPVSGGAVLGFSGRF